MENPENSETSVNQELKELCDADQSDRNNWLAGNGNWETVEPRDKARLKRIEELYEQGLVKSAEDMLHAALIFQHGDSPEHYRRAMELSKKSMEMGNEEGKILYPKAEDRYLLSIGKPQVWGTQYRKRVGGSFDDVELVEPFDREAKTDEERKEFGIDLDKGLERAKNLFPAKK